MINSQTISTAFNSDTIRKRTTKNRRLPFLHRRTDRGGRAGGKKGLMQQLFPAAGETLPKLRFPAFRDAPGWEVKLLGKTAKVLSGYRFPENCQQERMKNIRSTKSAIYQTLCNVGDTLLKKPPTISMQLRLRS